MDLHDRLDELTGILRDCWLKAVELKSGRDVWDEIRPALASSGHYRGVGRMLWTWYRDWTLVRVRNLVDTSRAHGPRSLVNALRGLRRIAPQVTPRLLAEVWQDQDDNRSSRQSLEERAARQLSVIVYGRTDGPDTALTRRAVQTDEERLLEVHADVVDLANRVVHAGPRTDASVSQDDVSALLDDVIRAADRWVGLIDRAHLASDAVRIGARPLTVALRLFDWREYVEAVSAEQERRGWETSFDQLAEQVRIRFVWDAGPS